MHDTLLYNNLVYNIRDPTRNSKATSTLIDPILTTIEIGYSQRGFFCMRSLRFLHFTRF